MNALENYRKGQIEKRTLSPWKARHIEDCYRLKTMGELSDDGHFERPRRIIAKEKTDTLNVRPLAFEDQEKMKKKEIGFRKLKSPKKNLETLEHQRDDYFSRVYPSRKNFETMDCFTENPMAKKVVVTIRSRKNNLSPDNPFNYN